MPEREKKNPGKWKRQGILACEGKEECRQVKEAGNTCLRRKNGIQASKRDRGYLPVKEKKNPGKWKGKGILA